MKITATLPFFGCKRSIAERIAYQFGDHSAYWGMCFGSLAVEMVKPRAHQEIVCDLHGGVTCLARTLANLETCLELYERLFKTPVSEGVFGDSIQWLHNHQPSGRANVEYAYHFMVASWLGRNGFVGTKKISESFCVRYTKNGGSPGKRFQSAVESIPDWHKRLRGITILQQSVFDLIPKIEDAPATVVYIDPPYLHKSTEYLHDCPALEEEEPENPGHKALAELLSRFQKTRVCVSYYDDPALDELYPRWTKIAFNVNKSLTLSKRGQGPSKAPEVLLINQPALPTEE